MCPLRSWPPFDVTVWTFGSRSPSDTDHGVRHRPLSAWPLVTSDVNAALIILSDYETKFGP
jgi:hypothetical protein